MKLGIIGLSGIGSFFVRGLSECLHKDLKGFRTLDPGKIEVIDNDKVEERNLVYTSYDVEDLEKFKAEIISVRYGYKAVNKEIKSQEELKDYDFLVLCVDNNALRLLVYQAQIPFLDLRAKGRALIAFLVADFSNEDAQDYLKFTDDNNQRASCQYEPDIEERSIQFANRLVADLGLQILRDYLVEGVLIKKYVLQI